MKRVGFFLTLLWGARCAEDPDDLDDLDLEDIDHVVALTEGTYSNFIKKHERVLVEFYAPWCGHCKALEPEYKKAAATLAAKKSKTKLAKVDATVEQSLASEHDVKGYPTLKYYVNGEATDYKGPREADGIVSWLEKKEKNPVELCTEENLETQLEKNDVPYQIVARVVKKSGKAVAVKKAMETIANAELLGDYFACSIYIPKEKETDASLTFIRRHALKGESPRQEVYAPRKWSGTAVHKWVLWASVASITKKGKVNTPFMGEQFLPNSKGNVLTLYPSRTEGKVDREVFADVLLKLKKSAENEVVAYDERLTTEYDDTRERFVLLTDTEGKVYAEPDETKFDTLLQRKLAGEVKPWYKTSKKTTEYKGDVRQIYGRNFEEVALDPKVDVFVKFYAPSCGHCKAMASDWDELAKRVKAMGLSDKIVVAEFDATENQCEEEITGFPKLMLYPAKKNSIRAKVEYSGPERKVDPMLDFLIENARNADGVELPSDLKIDKSGFNMVEREIKKKKSKKQEL